MDDATEFDRLNVQIKHMEFVRTVNNELALFQNTGDARFFWRAFLRIREAGQPIPDDFLDKLAQWGAKLLTARTPHEIAAALELTGDDKRYVGPKKSDAYRRRWMIASEVKNVQSLYRLKLTKAIETVARNRGLSVPKVKRDYHEVFTAPLKQTKPKKSGTLDAAMRAWR